MTSAAGRRPKSLSRRFAALAVVVALAVAGWSAAWWWLADRAEREIAAGITRAAAGGVAVRCAPRSIAGYPFRIEVRCGDAGLSLAGGQTLSAAGLVAVALAYDPRRMIFELDGPLAAAAPGEPAVGLSWETARASVRLASPALQALDVSVAAPALALDGTAAGSARLVEVHARRDPQPGAGSDVAVTIEGAVATDVVVAGRSLPPLDVAVVATLADGGAILAGRGLLAGEVPEDGLPITIVGARFGDGAVTLDVTGAVTLRPDGRLDGAIEAGIADPAALAPFLARFLPEGDPLPQAIASAAQALGGPGRDGRGRRLPLTLDAGRVSIGFVPLGRIPPLPLPGR